MTHSPPTVTDSGHPALSPAGLETVSCPQCGATDGALWLAARDLEFDGRETFQLVACPSCGLVYLNPRPDPAHMGRYYPAAYYTHASLADVRLAHTYRDALALAQRWGRPGSWLDVGAGDGAFLTLLRQRGWTDIQGLEPDAAARRAAATRGLTLLSGGFPDQAPTGLTFDNVSMLEVIEHLHEPLAALRAAHDLLAPGGRLILSTPNISGLEFRLLGARSVSLQVPRHLSFFAPRSLEVMLRLAGLRPLSIGTSAATDGITRSLWLWARRAARGGRTVGSAGPSTGVAFQPMSWRRRVHEGMELALRPLGWLLTRSHLGPTLLAVAERPLDD